MLGADFFQALRRFRLPSLNRRALRPELLLFVAQPAALGGEGSDLRLAREKRGVLFADTAAINHAFSGNEIARESGEGEGRPLLLQSLGQIEIGHQHDIA